MPVTATAMMQRNEAQVRFELIDPALEGRGRNRRTDIVKQFERAGTAALEAKDLWRTPEIRELKGWQALNQGGLPDELIRKTKETLFVA